MDLLPNLNHATDGFLAVSDAQTALAKALNNTKNCGSSGSSTPVLNVAKGNANVSQAFFALASALRNNTNRVDQLKLLICGNLTTVTDEIENAGDALISLSGDIRTLADNIDTVSLNGVDQLVADLEKLVKASIEFDEAFTNFALLPSRLLLQFVSIPVLSNFTNSVHQAQMGYEVELKAVKAAEARCGISTGLADVIGRLAEIRHTVYEHLRVLA